MKEKFKIFIKNYSVAIFSCAMMALLLGVWFTFANPTKTIIGDDVDVVGNTTLRGSVEDGEGNAWGVYSESNSNGTCSRFPDGTQFCYGIINYVTAETSNTINLPLSFNDTNYQITYGDRNRSLDQLGVATTPSRTSSSFTVQGFYDNVGHVNGPRYSTHHVDYIAIGRWK